MLTGDTLDNVMVVTMADSATTSVANVGELVHNSKPFLVCDSANFNICEPTYKS